MSEFKMKPQRVRSAAQDMSDIAKKMNDLEEEILKIRGRLSFEVAQKERIRQRLKTAGDNTEMQYRGIYSASSTLNNIVNTYEASESRLAGASIPQYEKQMDTLWDRIKDILSLSPLLLSPVVPSLGIGVPVPGTQIGPLVDKLIYGDRALDEKNETEIKFGTIQKKIHKTEPEHEKNFVSVNNKKDELSQSDIKPFKIIEGKWENTKSLFQSEGSVGDKDGTHLSYQFDVLKREKSAELYGGLYCTDSSTGEKKLRLAAGAELGYTLSALTLKLEEQWGDSNFGAYAKGEATAGKVEAKFSGVVGLRDGDGKLNPTAHVKLSAEALAGELSGKLGVKILGGDVGVKGSVNMGIGAHLEGGFKDGKLSLDAGAALWVGASVKLEVDIGGMVDTVCGTAKSVWNKFTGWIK